HDQLRRLHQMAAIFAPWLLTEDQALIDDLGVRPQADVRQLTLDQGIKTLEALASSLGEILSRTNLNEDSRKKTEALSRKVSARLERARSLHGMMEELAETCEALAHQMDFGFLYNRQRKLLSIGYTKSANRLESACYDLLASEARIATFVAIAKGDIPQASWFYLGRGQTQCENQRVLISWAGSLFEYLMPNLWMRAHPNTLLHTS